jgi:hypothetical protein
MGGKGGGGGDYYAQPADTSGYGTPEEAKATLAKTAPLDMSSYQQSIDVQKAAADATAPKVADTGTAADNDTSASGSSVGATMGSSVLSPPTYWSNRQDLQPASLKKSSMQTTQT